MIPRMFTTEQIFIDVIRRSIGSQREINDGGSETGKNFRLQPGDVKGIAQNLATWWEIVCDAIPSPDDAEEYFDEVYPPEV